MQVQIRKEEKKEQIKIGIVGPSKPKWKNPEQYERMKEKIKEILMLYISSMNRPRLDGKLVVVSGHCPVGEERWFNITMNWWEERKEILQILNPYISNNNMIVFGRDGIEEKFIQVYTKGGVDTEAEIIAHQLGCKTEIYPAVCTNEVFIRNGHDEVRHNFQVPREHYWQYHYKPRNIQTAKAVDVLYCLVPFNKDAVCGHHKPELPSEWSKKNIGHLKNGGCWTYNYAEKTFGKETHLVVIP